MSKANSAIDFSSFTPVTTGRASRQHYDMRSQGDEGVRFQLSNMAWERLRMENNAMQIVVNASGNVALHIVPEGTRGAIFNQKQSKNPDVSFEKGKFFNSPKLRTLLDEAGLSGITTFRLTPHNVNGSIYLTIEEWTDNTTSGLTGFTASSIEIDTQKVGEELTV